MIHPRAEVHTPFHSHSRNFRGPPLLGTTSILYCKNNVLVFFYDHIKSLDGKIIIRLEGREEEYFGFRDLNKTGVILPDGS